MMIDFLRAAQKSWVSLVSFVRLLLPRCLGLRTGSGVRVGCGINWPLGNLRNLQLGENVSLGKNGWFYLPLNNREARIQVGSGTSVGNGFVITANKSVKIGCDCLISYRVAIMDHSHVTGWGVKPVSSGLTEGNIVEIGDCCFIGCGAVIMPGVRIGANCVVGANSVVTKSFEAGSVVAGTPAKLLRSIAPAKS
jgi:acetyltransferase-like isoleucine patch superfamily enzyme